jgi:hypothetical protein
MNRDRRWPVPNLTAISLSTRLLPIALAQNAMDAGPTDTQPAGDFQGASRPSDLSSLIITSLSPGGRQKALIAAFLFALAMPFPLIANSDADQTDDLVPYHRAVCWSCVCRRSTGLRDRETAINANGYGCRQRGGDDAAVRRDSLL